MLEQIIQLLKEEEGQSMVEYGIILALISVVAIGTIKTIGTKLKDDAFGVVDSKLNDLKAKP